MAFPDQGTVVARAVEQAVGLFNAFDYLDASGNLMVIFTDGADADVLENGKTVDDVLAEAQKAKIPVYLIKIGGNIQNKRSVADELWIGAVKKTGGEFFSGGDEATIIQRHPGDRSARRRQDRDEAIQHRAAALRAVRDDRGAALVRGAVAAFHDSDVPDVSVGDADMKSSSWFGQAVDRDRPRRRRRDPVAIVGARAAPRGGRARSRHAEVRRRGRGRGAAGRPPRRPDAGVEDGRRTRRRSPRPPGTGAAITTRRSKIPTRSCSPPMRTYPQDSRRPADRGRPWSAAWIRVVKQYAEILRENPTNTEAAFNYEYVVRLRAVIRGAEAAGAAARRQGQRPHHSRLRRRAARRVGHEEVQDDRADASRRAARSGEGRQGNDQGAERARAQDLRTSGP